jgi:hypothetical protein
MREVYFIITVNGNHIIHKIIDLLHSKLMWPFTKPFCQGPSTGHLKVLLQGTSGPFYRAPQSIYCKLLLKHLKALLQGTSGPFYRAPQGPATGNTRALLQIILAPLFKELHCLLQGSQLHIAVYPLLFQSA